MSQLGSPEPLADTAHLPFRKWFSVLVIVVGIAWPLPWVSFQLALDSEVLGSLASVSVLVPFLIFQAHTTKHEQTRCWVNRLIEWVSRFIVEWIFCGLQFSTFIRPWKRTFVHLGWWHDTALITGEADSPHGPVAEETGPGGTGLCHLCPKMKGYRDSPSRIH